MSDNIESAAKTYRRMTVNESYSGGSLLEGDFHNKEEAIEAWMRAFQPLYAEHDIPADELVGMLVVVVYDESGEKEEAVFAPSRTTTFTQEPFPIPVRG